MIASNVNNTFGFHTRNTIPGAYKHNIKFLNRKTRQHEFYSNLNVAKTDAIFFNALQIAGYIPVVGLIPFAARLIVPLFNEESAMHQEPADVKKAHYIRAIFEGLGMGILYLIPDIIVTLDRFAPSTYAGRVHQLNENNNRWETNLARQL